MGHADLLRKLKQVEDNAWMLFNELPPCVARTRALHMFLDAKELKSRIEMLPSAAPEGNATPQNDAG